MSDFLSKNGVFVTIDSLRSASAAELVLYVGVTSLQPSEIFDLIKAFIERETKKFTSICFVAPKFREEKVIRVCEYDEFVQFKERLGVESYLCLFGRNGEIDCIDSDCRSRMLRRILTKIVRERHGVLGASAAVHYAKPSQKHSDLFIRTGNVLVNSVEVEMIAWGCLSHISDEIAFVYTDTGAINVVATTVRELLTGFKIASTFSIDSFGSYKGLETFAGERTDSIWMISATTSGNLSQKIAKNQGIDLKHIISLFSLGASNEIAVCHLDFDDLHNRDGFPKIRSYSPNDCELCRVGSTPLWLTDEQFLVSDIAVTPYLPKLADLSKDTLAALHQFVGNKVFRVLFQPNRRTERSDIFLDIEPHANGLLTQPESSSVAALAAQVRRRVQQSLPAAVDAIVHLDDPASQALATDLVSYLSTHKVNPALIAASKLSTYTFRTPPESVVVVASTVALGTAVVDVSRTLRLQDSVKSVSYIVLIDRSITAERAKQIHQSVTITKDGHRYDYHVIARLPLPDPSAVATNAWNDETILLNELLNSGLDEGLRSTLETRRNLLDQAKAQTQRGLKDDLFWSSESGGLALSPGFVFFPKDFDVSSASQADIYSVMRCLLHGLRTKVSDGKEPPLKQHPLHRKVLEVGVFDRFNDPVLQAAILRAASPAELDYANSDIGNQSANARMLLMSVFKDSKAPATEFALALALRRMRLTECDKKLVLEEVSSLSLNMVTQAFLDIWKLM